MARRPAFVLYILGIFQMYEIISLHSSPQWRIPAVRWFQEKWEIPLGEYLTSIDECIEGRTDIPQWYIMTDGSWKNNGVSLRAPRCSLINCADKPLARIEISLLRSDS